MVIDSCNVNSEPHPPPSDEIPEFEGKRNSHITEEIHTWNSWKAFRPADFPVINPRQLRMPLQCDSVELAGICQNLKRRS